MTMRDGHVKLIYLEFEPGSGWAMPFGMLLFRRVQSSPMGANRLVNGEGVELHRPFPTMVQGTKEIAIIGEWYERSRVRF